MKMSAHQWRALRRNKNQKKVNRVGQISSISKRHKHPNSIDNIIGRLSNLAQVGTLILAAFGYFYTVLPVFQNQKLQEDNAKLQIDNESAQKKLTNLLSEQAAITQKTAALQNQLKLVKSAEAQSAKKAFEEQQRATLATSAANHSAAKLKIELGNLASARWKITMTNFSQSIFFEGIRQNSNFLNTLYANNDAIGDFIINSETVWPNPLKIVQTGLEHANKKNDIPKSYLDELHKTITEYSSILSCPAPDFAGLHRKYLEEAKNIDADSKQEALIEIERQRIEAEKKGKRLLVTEESIDQITRSYRIGKTYSLNSKYRDIIIKSEDTCTKSIHKFLDTAYKRVGISE